DKLYYSEMDKRHQELMQEVLGPYGQLEELPPELALRGQNQEGLDGSWAYNVLWSRAGVIYAGSSQIQKNIIGERVLGLPREVRSDRLASSRE
ncbi:MAG TPA: acyl-CoA dehydrogenase, partial [Chloroflexota bacterium]